MGLRLQLRKYIVGLCVMYGVCAGLMVYALLVKEWVGSEDQTYEFTGSLEGVLTSSTEFIQEGDYDEVLAQAEYIHDSSGIALKYMTEDMRGYQDMTEISQVSESIISLIEKERPDKGLFLLYESLSVVATFTTMILLVSELLFKRFYYLSIISGFIALTLSFLSFASVYSEKVSLLSKCDVFHEGVAPGTLCGLAGPVVIVSLLWVLLLTYIGNISLVALHYVFRRKKKAENKLGGNPACLDEY